MRYQVRYVAGDAIVYQTELIAEEPREAAISARIGLRWARSTFGAEAYQIVDDRGDIVATGP